MTREQLIEVIAKARFEKMTNIRWSHVRQDDRPAYIQGAETALNALTAAGMVVVPKEPTEAMIRAGHHKIDWCRDSQDTSVPNHSSQKTAVGGVLCGSYCGDDLRDAYRAMTEAAQRILAESTEAANAG